MISLIASLAGFLTSLLPTILQMVREYREHRHELELFDRQIKLQHKGGNTKSLEIMPIGAANSLAQISDNSHLYKTYNSGIKFVDAINGLVRPFMAYGFFALYGLVKLIQLRSLQELGNPELLASIWWNEEDQAIFATILSFYFGHRAASKITKI